MAYHSYVSCRYIGFDPSNRDGCGGTAKDIPELAEDILLVGWSPDEVTHACMAEIEPGDTSVEEFNEQFVASAAIPLPPVEKGSIKYGSVSCGHTNYVHKCFYYEAPSASKQVGDGSRFRLALLEERDALFADAVKKGMRWLVLKWQVRILYPQLLGLLQASRNTRGHIQRAETEVQGLKRMFDLWAKQVLANVPWSFDTIKRTVCRSRPPWASDVEHYVRFLSTKSGGPDGFLLQEFASWHAGNVPSGRNLGGRVLIACAVCPSTLVCYVILMALFMAEPVYWQGSMCILSNAKALHLIIAKEKANMASANEFLTFIRNVLAYGCPGNILFAEVGENMPGRALALRQSYEIKVGRFVLGKLADIDSIDEIGRQFKTELQFLFPRADMKVLHSKWVIVAKAASAAPPSLASGTTGVSAPRAASAAGSAPAPKKAKTETTLVEDPVLHNHSDDGSNTSVAHALEQAGLRVGQEVSLGAGRSYWTIVAFHEVSPGRSRAVEVLRSPGDSSLESCLDRSFPQIGVTTAMSQADAAANEFELLKPALIVEKVSVKRGRLAPDEALASSAVPPVLGDKAFFVPEEFVKIAKVGKKPFCPLCIARALARQACVRFPAVPLVLYSRKRAACYGFGYGKARHLLFFEGLRRRLGEACLGRCCFDRYSPLTPGRWRLPHCIYFVLLENE